MEYLQKKPSDAGIRPSEETHRMISHGAMVIGTVYAVDMDSATAATDYFATTTKTAVAGTGGEGVIYCVCLETATAINQKVLCGFRGKFPVLSGAAYNGDTFQTVNGAGELIAATAGTVIVAKTGEPNVSDATIVDHWFDGLGGFGIKHD